MELEEAVRRHGAGDAALEAIAWILDALAKEPDPHTTVPPEEWAAVHVADSLAALAIPAVREAQAIADIGAGAGFPGLPLAAALARTRVVLVESAGRKVGLIERLIEAGGLTNARAIRARAEEWGAAEPSSEEPPSRSDGPSGREAYDVVVARAVGPLALLAEYAAPLLRRDGVLVAWKGRRDREEEAAGARAAERLGLEVEEVLPAEPYPGSRDRHLHLYRKLRPTPDGFPRRPGVAAKRPLG